MKESRQLQGPLIRLYCPVHEVWEVDVDDPSACDYCCYPTKPCPHHPESWEVGILPAFGRDVEVVILDDGNPLDG